MSSYTIRGENITCNPEPANPPFGAQYDVRTLPQRVDDELAAMRAEVSTLRRVVTELVDALEELGVRMPKGERAR